MFLIVKNHFLNVAKEYPVSMKYMNYSKQFNGQDMRSYELIISEILSRLKILIDNYEILGENISKRETDNFKFDVLNKFELYDNQLNWVANVNFNDTGNLNLSNFGTKNLKKSSEYIVTIPEQFF